MRSAMKRLPVALLVCAAFGAAACSSDAPEDDTALTDSALISGEVHLDRVTPAEVAATFAADLREPLSACIRGNPGIVNVDASNLAAFYRPGIELFWDVKVALDGMLSEPGVTSVPVATLDVEVGAWATRAMSAHADAEGFYAPRADAPLAFYAAETKTREAKSLSVAAAPGGKPMSEIRDMWREVQLVRRGLDSSWLTPVKITGSPSVGDLRRVMRLPYAGRYAGWGHGAVDQFGAAREGPAAIPAFEALAALLHSSAIKKRWYFQGESAHWSSNVLIVLDQHDQLWGLQMGYSE